MIPVVSPYAMRLKCEDMAARVKATWGDGEFTFQDVKKVVRHPPVLVAMHTRGLVRKCGWVKIPVKRRSKWNWKKHWVRTWQLV